jgi:hypothetical protein
MCPPCDANDEIDPAEGDRYGNRTDEVALKRKMVALGISIFEPDPLAAISANR